MLKEEYFKKYYQQCVDYDKSYGYQCVDLVRHYFDKVYDYKIGTFGGSALTGWKNEKKTFPLKDFYKIEGYKDLKEGDIIFFDQGKYGHVAIVTEILRGGFEIIEQNGGKGNGSGKDSDAIRFKVYSYDEIEIMQKILGVWRYKFKGWELYNQEQKEIMKKALELGYWNGERPNENITRAEAIFMLMKK